MDILIFGATSDIAQELAKLYIQKDDEVTLLGIDTESLMPFQADIEVRYGKKISLVEFDIHNYKSPNQKLIELIETSDISIMLIGYLGNQDLADQDDEDRSRLRWDEEKALHLRRQRGALGGAHVRAEAQEVAIREDSQKHTQSREPSLQVQVDSLGLKARLRAIGGDG